MPSAFRSLRPLSNAPLLPIAISSNLRTPTRSSTACGLRPSLALVAAFCLVQLAVRNILLIINGINQSIGELKQSIFTLS